MFIISLYVVRHIDSSLALLVELIAGREMSAHVHERKESKHFICRLGLESREKKIIFPSIPHYLALLHSAASVIFPANYPHPTSNRVKMSNGWVSPTPSKSLFSDPQEPRFEERNGSVSISEFSMCDAKCTKMTELVVKRCRERRESSFSLVT